MTNDVRHRGSNSPVVAVASLRKTYRGGVTALDGLDRPAPAMTIFGLLGPNGAGKTTTVKILTTLSRPDEGTAEVAGVDVLSQPDRVRRGVGGVAPRSGAAIQATRTGKLPLRARG